MNVKTLLLKRLQKFSATSGSALEIGADMKITARQNYIKTLLTHSIVPRDIFLSNSAGAMTLSAGYQRLYRVRVGQDDVSTSDISCDDVTPEIIAEARGTITRFLEMPGKIEVNFHRVSLHASGGTDVDILYAKTAPKVKATKKPRAKKPKAVLDQGTQNPYRFLDLARMHCLKTAYFTDDTSDSARAKLDQQVARDSIEPFNEICEKLSVSLGPELLFVFIPSGHSDENYAIARDISQSAAVSFNRLKFGQILGSWQSATKD